MAEVQTAQQTGEFAQRFIEFVLMHSQQAAFALGLIPHPSGERHEPNLETAQMFIDQLAMIREKTRGNLSAEETRILDDALTQLRMAFVEVSSAVGQTGAVSAAPEPVSEPGQRPAPAAEATVEEDSSSKKRFTKSYGS